MTDKAFAQTEALFDELKQTMVAFRKRHALVKSTEFCAAVAAVSAVIMESESSSTWSVVPIPKKFAGEYLENLRESIETNECTNPSQ